MKNKLFIVSYIIAVIVFSIYMILDTLVIEKEYSGDNIQAKYEILDTSKASLFVEMQETYFPWEERFIFISPEGKILGKCDSDQLNEEFKKYFPFAQ